MKTPYHQHDSDSSIYLKSEIYKDQKYDFYYAPNKTNPTVIARFGELGDYFSGLLFVKSLIDTKIDITKQLDKLIESKDEDIYLLSKATKLSIEQGFLTKELIQDDRNCAIFSLQKNLNNIFEVLIHDNSFHKHVQEDFKTFFSYYKDINDCYETQKTSLKNHIIERYTNSSANGYKHVSAESILLENRIWNFIQNNPEQWYCMIEPIKNNENSSNIYTVDGFSFVDSFIHNGIYDDFPLFIAKKDNEIILVSTSDEQKVKALKNENYEIKHLDEKSMIELLNDLEAPKIKTPKLNKPL